MIEDIPEYLTPGHMCSSVRDRMARLHGGIAWRASQSFGPDKLARALSMISESGTMLYLIDLSQFPGRKMNSFSLKLL
jgi:hypothetical protein